MRTYEIWCSACGSSGDGRTVGLDGLDDWELKLQHQHKETGRAVSGQDISPKLHGEGGNEVLKNEVRC